MNDQNRPMHKRSVRRTSRWPEIAAMLAVLCTAGRLHASAFPLSFIDTYPAGVNPTGLIRATDSNFYGTTWLGGTGGSSGTFFRATASGTLTTLYAFNNQGDGYLPMGTLVQDPADGNFYGETNAGGSTNGGAVYRITPAGVVTTLYSFTNNADNDGDGYAPYAGLVLSHDGGLYGTTQGGGKYGYGTIFKVVDPTTTPKLTTIYAFTGGSAGQYPTDALVVGRDGNLYGTTEGDFGKTNWGTIFQITPDGKFTNLYTLAASGADGEYPSSLVQGPGTDPNFYGTTKYGGADGVGTIFRIGLGSPFTTLHSFEGVAIDGASPGSALTVGGDGKLYGTTIGVPGGPNWGTVFSTTTAATDITTFFTFSGKDGAQPIGALVQAPDGYFYGTTDLGGSGFGAVTGPNQDGTGTVFRRWLTPSLPPTNLTATAGNEEVTLTWTASNAATGYDIFRGAISHDESPTSIANVSTTTFSNTGLTNGTTYYYLVKAVNAAGTSTISNEASATPRLAIPAPPTDLTAVGSTGKIALTWSGSVSATSYNVYRSTTSDDESPTPIASEISSTSYANTGLTDGRTYYYLVKAVNSLGTSTKSNQASATP